MSSIIKNIMFGLHSDQENRYDIFVKTVKETKKVWSLKSNNGWVHSPSTEYEDVVVLPFWSHETYAKAVAKEILEKN